MALKRGIVELEEFSLEWAKEYEKEEKLLKEVLGDIIKEIYHVGSTSIKGLKAKPIIDILLVIDSLSKIEEIEKILVNYGYTNMGCQGIEGRYFFPKGSDDARTHYVHIVEPKSDTYYNQLLFKRYLLDHKEYIDEYCNLKQELALKYADDRKKYTASKSSFINNVINLAKKEYGIE